MFVKLWYDLSRFLPLPVFIILLAAAFFVFTLSKAAEVEWKDARVVERIEEDEVLPSWTTGRLNFAAAITLFGRTSGKARIAAANIVRDSILALLYN